MGTIIDLTGKQFSRLTVLEKSARSVAGQRMWHCRCLCGTSVEVQGNSLRYGKTRSCGCLSRDDLVARSTKHGNASRAFRTPAYSSWSNMWTRTTNKKFPQYADYGGRGIHVTPRWKDFSVFLADMGPCPQGMTLERLDVNEGYFPANCVWETEVTQANNKRCSVRYVTGSGSYTQAELGRRWGLSRKLTVKQIKALRLPVLSGPTRLSAPQNSPFYHRGRQ